MPVEKERPRPHGDPLESVVQSNSKPDLSDRAKGRGSSEDGIPEFDDGLSAQRKKQYDDGAELVSGTN